MKLYEAKHQYRCEEANYYAGDKSVSRCQSWQDFIDEYADADLDYNLVFRWDWRPNGEDWDRPLSEDPYYRDGVLYLYFMGQRKGCYFSVLVDVCKADEPAVRAWLLPRLEYLRKLWAPLWEEAATDPVTP